MIAVALRRLAVVRPPRPSSACTRATSATVAGPHARYEGIETTESRREDHDRRPWSGSTAATGVPPGHQPVRLRRPARSARRRCAPGCAEDVYLALLDVPEDAGRSRRHPRGDPAARHLAVDRRRHDGLRHRAGRLPGAGAAPPSPPRRRFPEPEPEPTPEPGAGRRREGGHRQVAGRRRAGRARRLHRSCWPPATVGGQHVGRLPADRPPGARRRRRDHRRRHLRSERPAGRVRARQLLRHLVRAVHPRAPRAGELRAAATATPATPPSCRWCSTVEPTQVRDFFADNGGDWPVVVDPDGRIALGYGVSGVPESYLVAPDGTVVTKFVGGVTARGLDQAARPGPGEVDDGAARRSRWPWLVLVALLAGALAVAVVGDRGPQTTGRAGPRPSPSRIKCPTCSGQSVADSDAPSPAASAPRSPAASRPARPTTRSATTSPASTATTSCSTRPAPASPAWSGSSPSPPWCWPSVGWSWSSAAGARRGRHRGLRRGPRAGRAGPPPTAVPS